MTHDANTITPAAASMPAELIALVKQAIASRTPVVDYGKAHKLMGHTPPASHYLLQPASTDQPIIDHYDRDMTVRVSAAATLGQVQKLLAPTRQYVPIDADDDLTFGEIINTNAYGPLRLSMGGVRDLLLGLHYIDGNACDIQVGGRTVKNVAGLDVTRLMVGSLGELGLIHQATLRTYAIPEHVLSVDMTLEDPQSLDGFLTQWLLTDASPASMLLERTADTWSLRVSFHGKDTACASQLNSLQTLLEAEPTMHITGSAAQTCEEQMAEHQERRKWQRHSNAVVKIIVPPASTGQALKQLDYFNHEQGKLMLTALPAHGCILAGGNFSAAQACSLDKTISELIHKHKGLRSWVSRPAGSEQDIKPFDPLPPALPLLLKLKTTMDPHHLFNPGRCLVQESSRSES